MEAAMASTWASQARVMTTAILILRTVSDPVVDNKEEAFTFHHINLCWQGVDELVSSGSELRAKLAIGMHG